MKIKYPLLAILSLLILVCISQIAGAAITDNYSMHFIHWYNGTDDGAITGYQYHVKIFNTSGTNTTDTLFIEGATLDNIFITSSGGTNVSYWVESQNSSCIDFWYKANTPANATTQDYINLYIGDADGQSYSNGTTTFPLLYDDFTTLDTTNKWTNFGNYASVADGLLNCTRIASDPDLRSKNAFGLNISVRTSIKATHYDSTSYTERFGMYATTTYYIYADFSSGTSSLAGNYNNRAGGTITSPSIAGYTENTWRTLDIQRNPSSIVYTLNDTNMVTSSTNIPTNDTFLVRYWISTTEGSQVYADWILIRNTTPNTPTGYNWTVVSEDTPIPPVADFSADDTTIIENDTVTFTDLSTNTPTSWAWNFGGAEGNSTSQNPTHQYNTTGSYTITLTVTNADGSDVEQKIDYITVSEPAPEPVETPAWVPYMQNFTHASAPLNITTYDGTNDMLHDYTLYVPLVEGYNQTNTTWNGWEFIKIFTPYPKNSTIEYADAHENPCLVFSHNGLDWYQMDEIPTPFVDKPSVGFNRDPFLMLYPNGTLIVGYSWASAEATPDDVKTIVYLVSPNLTISSPMNLTMAYNRWTRSPSIEYNNTTGEHILYGHWMTGGLLCRYVSTTGLNGTFYPRGYNGDNSFGYCNITLPDGYDQWHSEVKINPLNGLHYTTIYTIDGQMLWVLWSQDGTNFTMGANNPIFVGRPGYWDAELYKSSLVVTETKYILYYSGNNNTDRGIGYSEQYINEPGLPVADFEANVTSGTAPLTVGFTDLSTGNVTGYQWDFGDETANSTEQNPVHEYASAGTYSVMLTVSNDTLSNSSVKNDMITVQEVDAGYVTEGLEVYYDWSQDDADTIVDLSGNGNNATNYGSTLFELPSGAYYRHFAIDDYIQKTDFTIEYPLSIEMIVDVDNVASYNGLICLNNSTSTANYQALQIANNSKFIARSSIETYRLSPTINNRERYHVVYTDLDGTNSANINIYINGQLANGNPGTIDTPANVNTLIIGKMAKTGWNLNGNISLVRIYSGNLLNESEVLSNYENELWRDNGTIQFSQINQTTTEAEGVNVTLTVNLDNEKIISTSVDYQTINGTGLAYIDFEPASGTLTFAPGETSKTINIALHNDTALNGEKYFYVELSNTVNATIGTNNSCNVTIAPTKIRWSNYNWTIYSRYIINNNTDYADTWHNTLHVDDNGYLHLNMVYSDSVWHFPKIRIDPVDGAYNGYGVYSFNLQTDTIEIFDSLPSADLATFLYESGTAAINIENTQWGFEEYYANKNVFLGAYGPGGWSGTLNWNATSLPSTENMTEKIYWTPDYVAFTFEGPNTPYNVTYITNNSNIPVPNHMWSWIFYKVAQDVSLGSHVYPPGNVSYYTSEVVIKNFTFEEHTTDPVISASFTADKTSGNNPLTIQFTDGTIGRPISWQWDFGDNSENSTEQSPEHIYSTPGTYNVTLTAYNEIDGISTIERAGYITVNAVPTPTPTPAPTPIPAPEITDFTATPTSSTAPANIAFSSITTGLITQYYWNFGDGTASTEPNPTHVYISTGHFDVTLTLSNSGGSDSMTKASYIYIKDNSDQLYNITGGIGNVTLAPMADNTIMNLVNDTLGTELGDIDASKLLYDVGRPYTYYGFGNLWILLVIGTLAAIILFGQGNSPFLIILPAMMFGSAVIWVMIPIGFIPTIVTLIIFNLSCIVLAVVRGPVK